MFVGAFAIDDLLTFYVNTHDPATGAETDADAAPGYRVYEDETTAPLLTGTMALLDDTNTVGFYSEQITLSAANGFEASKSYSIRIRAVVGGVAGSAVYTFQMNRLTSPAIVAALTGRTGTAQAGAATTITLDAGASAVDDAYNGWLIAIVKGTGRGQVRIIADYVGATKVATVATWDTNPDSTSVFVMLPQ